MLTSSHNSGSAVFLTDYVHTFAAQPLANQGQSRSTPKHFVVVSAALETTL